MSLNPNEKQGKFSSFLDFLEMGAVGKQVLPLCG